MGSTLPKSEQPSAALPKVWEIQQAFRFKGPQGHFRTVDLNYVIPDSEDPELWEESIREAISKVQGELIAALCEFIVGYYLAHPESQPK